MRNQGIKISSEILRKILFHSGGGKSEIISHHNQSIHTIKQLDYNKFRIIRVVNSSGKMKGKPYFA